MGWQRWLRSPCVSHPQVSVTGLQGQVCGVDGGQQRSQQHWTPETAVQIVAASAWLLKRHFCSVEVGIASWLTNVIPGSTAVPVIPWATNILRTESLPSYFKTRFASSVHNKEPQLVCGLCASTEEGAVAFIRVTGFSVSDTSLTAFQSQLCLFHASWPTFPLYKAGLIKSALQCGCVRNKQ